MTKKRALAAGIAVAVGCVVIWWRLRDESAQSAESSATDQVERREPNPRLRKRVDVRKLPKASIAGRVTDPDGAALAGARVCATTSDDEARRMPTCTLSNAGGRYSLPGLTPAKWSVAASLAGHIPANYWKTDEDGDDTSSIELEAGQDESGIDIVLRPGGVKVHGVVNDIGGGPVAGAWVSVRGNGNRITAGKPR